MLARGADLLRALPVLVGRLVAPRVVEGRARLVEHAALVVRRDLVVAGGRVVADHPPVRPLARAAADPGVHEAPGLQAPHERIEVERLVLREREADVEPNEREVAVLRKDLLDLRLRLLLEVAGEVLLRLVREVPVVRPGGRAAAPVVGMGVAAAVGMAPVEVLRIVEPEPEAVLPAGLGELAHDVAPERRGVDDVELRDLRAEHREAVVVLRGEDDVLHPGVAGDPHPFVGVEEDRIERLRERRILGVGDAEVGLRPFRDAGHHAPAPLAAEEGVEPPVDHQPVLGLLEPPAGGLQLRFVFVCHCRFPVGFIHCRYSITPSENTNGHFAK